MRRTYISTLWPLPRVVTMQERTHARTHILNDQTDCPANQPMKLVSNSMEQNTLSRNQNINLPSIQLESLLFI